MEPISSVPQASGCSTLKQNIFSNVTLDAGSHLAAHNDMITGNSRGDEEEGDC